MDLLEKASIILTPTASNNGEALCVKPSDGSGDFDFSRNSAATRVNAQGLVENVQTISGNLLDYSTFTSPSASWSLVGGLWVFDDTANGYLTTPNLAVVVGDVYNVVVDVTIASGNANFRYQSGNGQTKLFDYTDFVDGVNEFQTTVTGVDGSLQRLFAPASLTDNPFTLNSISIKKISQDTNLPRINYESGCGSWLFEPQSTNFITYSEDFSQWSTAGTPTITLNYGTSPSGENNSVRIQGNSSAVIFVANSAATTNFSRSIYIKATSGSGSIQALSHNTNTNNIFNIDENWQRIDINSLTSSSGSNIFYALDMRGASTDIFDVEIWGCQEERGINYATSYIPTEGTSVTRNQDVCTNGGSLASINSTEGVLYFEGSALVNGGSNRLVSLSDETNNNLVQFRFDTTPNRITSFIRGNGGSYAIKTINGFTQSNNNKVALVWNATNLRIWINGTESGSVSTNDLPIGMDNLSFTQPTGGASTFFGKTKALAVWKEALSDEELTELTTI